MTTDPLRRLVDDCHAEGFVNCALDTWNGCTRIRFLNNTLVTGPDCVQVININGVTDDGGDDTADDFLVAGNQITLRNSAATAIFLATLGKGSTVSNGRVTNNTILGDPRRGGYGIVGRGLGGEFIISGNHLADLSPAPSIWIDTGFYDGKTAMPTTNCVIVNNIIARPKVTTGPLGGKAAAIALTGDGHYCAGNRVIGGSYQWLVWSNSASAVVGPNFGAAGSLGRYGDDGFHHALVLDADPQAGGWHFQGDLTAGRNLVLPNLPTKPAGLPKGAVWNNQGTLMVVP